MPLSSFEFRAGDRRTSEHELPKTSDSIFTMRVSDRGLGWEKEEPHERANGAPVPCTVRSNPRIAGRLARREEVQADAAASKRNQPRLEPRASASNAGRARRWRRGSAQSAGPPYRPRRRSRRRRIRSTRSSRPSNQNGTVTTRTTTTATMAIIVAARRSRIPRQISSGPASHDPAVERCSCCRISDWASLIECTSTVRRCTAVRVS